MVYYTQLIFIHKGKEDVFHTFEDHVLPLLKKYKGRLLYRLRSSESDVVETTIGYPYEVHLVSFETKEDFKRYAQDEERQRYLSMKDESVAKVLLIEGIAL